MRDSVASECPQEAAMQLQRLDTEGCLALQFWQITAPKINRIKHKGTNRSSVILSHLPAAPSSDRASPFPSRHDRYDPTKFFFPPSKAWGLHSRLQVGRRSRNLHACQVAQSAPRRGATGPLGLASPDASWWISWISGIIEEALPLSQSTC